MPEPKLTSLDYGQPLILFANAKTTKEAVFELYYNIPTLFNFSNEFFTKIQPIFASYPDDIDVSKYTKNEFGTFSAPYTIDDHPLIAHSKIGKLKSKEFVQFLHIELYRRNLIYLLTEIIVDTNLKKSKAFPIFLSVYNTELITGLMLNKDGFLIEEPNFIESELADDNTFNAQPFRVVAYLVIRFFKIQKNRQLIHQCHECKKYFIAKTLRKQMYCQDKCRLDWHNRERIESGEHAEYKRKKRRDGAKESYYG